MVYLPLAILVAGYFGVGYLYVFWGDEYTTRHASRLRQVLCGSHLRSFFTLVATPMNLGLVFGYLLQYLFDPMFQKFSDGVVFHVTLIFGLLAMVNVLTIYLGNSYKNSFYEYVLTPLIARYEKSRKIDTVVLTDYVESMFLAAQRNNTTAKQALESLLDREDELGVQARTILQELQAKYSTAESTDTSSAE